MANGQVCSSVRMRWLPRGAGLFSAAVLSCRLVHTDLDHRLPAAL